MNTDLHPDQKLLSIITASNRPHNMRGFLENLNQTVDNHDCFELLVKIDEGDEAMRSLMEEAIVKYDFAIHYIQTPRLDGYYTLHHGYQQLFEMSDKHTYFIFPVNEEVRFKTQGWDTVLKKYVKFFDDDLFRLKISRLKFRNYYSIQDCGPTPENYPFLTRKWMELAGGIGDCWGPDGWHQYIDYHMGLTEGIDGIPGLFRSVPILDILIGGEEAGKELSPETVRIRSHRIFQEWWRMYRTEAQQEFRRIATRMMAYVWAKNEKLKSFDIIDNRKIKCFSVKDHANGEIKKVFYYHLSTTYIRLDNFRFLIKMARRNSIGFLKAFMDPSYGTKHGIRQFLNVLIRSLLVILAVVFSFFYIGNESIPKMQFRRIYIRLKSVLGFSYHKLLHAIVQKVDASDATPKIHQVKGKFSKLKIVMQWCFINFRANIREKAMIIRIQSISIFHHIRLIMHSFAGIFKNVFAIITSFVPEVIKKPFVSMMLILMPNKEKKNERY